MQKRVKILLFSLVLLAMLVIACEDWDGMDRSGWPATATASVINEIELAATLTPQGE